VSTNFHTAGIWQTAILLPELKNTAAKYLIGMSVPPVMTAQIAHQIWLQWLSKTG